jgi:hypothetical protein
MISQQQNKEKIEKNGNKKFLKQIMSYKLS